MVLSKLLAKSSRKPKPSSEDPDQKPSTSAPSSPRNRRSPPPSPDKRERLRDRDRDPNQAPANSPSSQSNRSRQSTKHSRTPTSDSRNSAERQRNSPSPTKQSPTKQSRPSSLRNPLSWQSPRDSDRLNNASSIPDFRRHSTVPNMATQDPANGDPMDISSPGMNGADDDSPPAPPLHRVPTGPPALDPEACKAAGNKFFKNQQFDKAVEEYSKGWLDKTHIGSANTRSY
jgi:DnaJ family protein C protein 7